MNQTIKLKNNNTYYLAEVNNNFKDFDKLENILEAKIFNDDEETEFIGPHLTFNSPWSSNVLQIIERTGIKNVLKN